MAKVIAFVNFKGGVGKTASVVNIGADLAKFHGQRVLIVDLDAQSNSSLWLMRPPHWRTHVENKKNTVSQLFIDHLQGSHGFEFEEAVVRGVPRHEQDLPLIANLDLLPAAVDLIKTEYRLRQKSATPYFTFLHRALKEVRQQYDYILLDCPPNVFSITENALFAADHLVIPYIPDFLSLSGFECFVDLIEDFFDRASGQMTLRRRPKVAAFLISHYTQRRQVFTHGINELENLINQLRPEGKIHAKAEILTPYIRHCVRVAESTSEHLPVCLHDPSSNGAQDYADLTQNFLYHFESVIK